MGATPPVAILGSGVRVMRDRDAHSPSSLAENVFVTVHPSLLLRLTEPTDAREQFKMFARDLRIAASNVEPRRHRRDRNELRCLIKSPGSLPIDGAAGATHNQDVVNAGCRRSAKN